MNDTFNIPAAVLPVLFLLCSSAGVPAQAPARDGSEVSASERASRGESGARSVSLRALNRSIGRGVAYLLKRQSADGGWKSDFWGLMKSGQSLTPLVLNVLSRVPDDLLRTRPPEIRKAVRFIRAHRSKNGAIGFADPMVTGYPNYATALSVSALVRLKPDGWRASVRRMVDYLVDQQLDGTHGWTPDHEAFGGWAMGKKRPPSPPSPVHADLSRTRYVLAALSAAQEFVPEGVFERARAFLRRCRSRGAAADGGLVYTPVIPGENKAGSADGDLRSYGSPTADGILAMRYAGVSDASDDFTAALDWIDRHHRVETVPGLKDSGGAKWGRGLLFYYLSATTRVFGSVSNDRIRGGRKKVREIADTLVERQKPDGRWQNSVPLNRENDPLIATAFALEALLDAKAELVE